MKRREERVNQGDSRGVSRGEAFETEGYGVQVVDEGERRHYEGDVVAVEHPPQVHLTLPLVAFKSPGANLLHCKGQCKGAPFCTSPMTRRCRAPPTVCGCPPHPHDPERGFLVALSTALSTAQAMRKALGKRMRAAGRLGHGNPLHGKVSGRWLHGSLWGRCGS